MGLFARDATAAGAVAAVLEGQAFQMLMAVNATPIARASATSSVRAASSFRWQCQSLHRCHNSLAGKQIER